MRTNRFPDQAENGRCGIGALAQTMIAALGKLSRAGLAAQGGGLRLRLQSAPYTSVHSVKILVPLLLIFVVSGAFAAEAPTEDVLQQCRAALAAEKGAIPVKHWSTEPLPPDYRRVAGAALGQDTVGGWLAHRNPNGTLTIVIYAFDPETRERNFSLLFRDKELALKDDVYAFEFALSSRANNGVTGLFFCNKTGPSDEWVWNGNKWR